jgi:hypothetical protein
MQPRSESRQSPSDSPRVRYIVTPMASMTRAMTLSRSSCSQARTTFQPAALSASLARRSRATVRSSFGIQNHSLTPGRWPCTGQLCQKQESTNTATLRLVNATSGRTRPSGKSRRKSTLKRSPAACKARRRLSSGLVLTRRIARMFRLRPSVCGRGLSPRAYACSRRARLCSSISDAATEAFGCWLDREGTHLG